MFFSCPFPFIHFIKTSLFYLIFSFLFFLFFFFSGSFSFLPNFSFCFLFLLPFVFFLLVHLFSYTYTHAYTQDKRNRKLEQEGLTVRCCCCSLPLLFLFSANRERVAKTEWISYLAWPKQRKGGKRIKREFKVFWVRILLLGIKRSRRWARESLRGRFLPFNAAGRMRKQKERRRVSVERN